MALITDPDSLNQGFSKAVSDMVFGSSAGANTTITSAGGNLSSLTSGDYFEIRDHSNPVNNGLYLSTGAPSTSSIAATKQTGSNPANAGSEAATMLGANTTASTQKMVHFDVDAREVWLLTKGNLDNAGVTHQALYSFAKEEWKDDATLIAHPFPFEAITPEQFEWKFDWNPKNNTVRKLLRTGGWRELSSASVLQQEWTGVVTLGSFEDSVNDRAYYQQGNDPTDTGAGVNFDFNGPVNEAVKVYDLITSPATYTSIAITGANTITRTAGSWITEGYKKNGKITIAGAEDAGNNGTWTIATITATVLTITGGGLTNNAADTAMVAAANNRNILNLFLRVRDGDPNGKTYAQSRLVDIGVTGDVDNKVFRFPLSNATDLKINETDANIVANSPYTQIVPRYFDQAFSIEVDSATNRSFGIVVDVGTHSGVDGSVTSGGTVLTTAEAGITGANFTGGTLTVHDGTPDGTTYTISGTPAAGSVTITGGTFPATESNLSFTLQRATPISATAEQIYEKIQYLLRQAADIDSTDQTVTGKTAGALLRFVGDTLEAGQAVPTNPNGGGSGVIIMGFSANDTNRLTFYDNSAVARNFPFVAAGSLNFNANLVSDGDGKYWMYFEYTQRKSVADLAISASAGSTASIDSAGANLPTVVQNDYVNIQGATNPNNNGIWRVTDAAPTASQFDAIKVDGLTVANQTAFAGTVDKNPINSPQAIVVNNNVGSPIQGTISGPSVSFDFDYDNNVQGGRTAATNAVVVIRGIGLDTAQFVETTGTITRATGLSFSLVSSLERNYANA